MNAKRHSLEEPAPEGQVDYDVQLARLRLKTQLVALMAALVCLAALWSGLELVLGEVKGFAGLVILLLTAIAGAAFGHSFWVHEEKVLSRKYLGGRKTSREHCTVVERRCVIK
ncbi:MAG: hypothetical protein U5K77_00480 [Candidatus Saccharibacteria bacterium]|nr:hypothetical protein [Candidatus Saccharibacteria bacterium]